MSDLDKDSIKTAIEAEMKKAEQERQRAEAAVQSARASLERAEARKRELEATLGAGESIVGALSEADAIASGFCGRGFSPNPNLRLELVQGLKENDSMRLCSPPIYDKKIPLVVKVLGDVDIYDSRPVSQREEWHALVILRRVKKTPGAT